MSKRGALHGRVLPSYLVSYTIIDDPLATDGTYVTAINHAFGKSRLCQPGFRSDDSVPPR
jgi:hypothetical protein